MNAPVQKDYDFIKTVLSCSVTRLQESPEKWRQLFEKYDCKTLLDCDMSSEVNWVLQVIPTFNSPIVFSHNDFRFANTMVCDDNEVVVVDFEMASYYCRGYDFASLFENTDPNNRGIKEFVEHYIKEGHKMFGKSYSENPNNSVHQILKELKQFSMIYSLILVNVFIHNDFWQIPISEKTCMVSLQLAILFLLIN